jgi:hypothetical protein
MSPIKKFKEKGANFDKESACSSPLPKREKIGENSSDSISSGFDS